MLNDNECTRATNIPIPLERSPPVSFKRLLGRTTPESRSNSSFLAAHPNGGIVSHRHISQGALVLRKAEPASRAPYLPFPRRFKLDFNFPFTNDLDRKDSTTTLIEVDSIRVYGEARLRRNPTFGVTAGPSSTKLIRNHCLPLSTERCRKRHGECHRHAASHLTPPLCGLTDRA
jgi:hypothetical protein